MTTEDSGWVLFEDPLMKKGSWVGVPSPVLRCRKISDRARFLYSLLLDYAYQDGECFPGRDRLMEDMGIKKEDTLRAYVRELQKVKLIRVERRGYQQTNRYVFERIPKWMYKEYQQTTRKTGTLNYPKNGGSRLPENRVTTNKQFDQEDSFPSEKAQEAPDGRANTWAGRLYNRCSEMDYHLDDDDIKRYGRDFSRMEAKNVADTRLFRVLNLLANRVVTGARPSAQQVYNDLYKEHGKNGNNGKVVELNGRPRKSGGELTPSQRRRNTAEGLL